MMRSGNPGGGGGGGGERPAADGSAGRRPQREARRSQRAREAATDETLWMEHLDDDLEDVAALDGETDDERDVDYRWEGETEREERRPRGQRAGGRRRRARTAGGGGGGAAAAAAGASDSSDEWTTDDAEGEEALRVRVPRDFADIADQERLQLASGWGVDYARALTLKPDHAQRPIWVLPNGRIFLETFSPVYRQASDFLVAISEPVSRPEHVHEYALSPYSLYAAVSVGLDTDSILSVLERLSKTELPEAIPRLVRKCTSTYGKAKLVLHRNHYYVQSAYPEVLRYLLCDRVIAEARVTAAPATEGAEAAAVPEFTALALPIGDAQSTLQLPRPESPGRTASTADDGCVSREDAILELERRLEGDGGGGDDDADAAQAAALEDEAVRAARELGLDDDLFASAARPTEVLSFEVHAADVEHVKRRCLELQYPLLEEYDFRNDTQNPNTALDLKPHTRVRPYQEKSLAKMFAGGRHRRLHHEEDLSGAVHLGGIRRAVAPPVSAVEHRGRTRHRPLHRRAAPDRADRRHDHHLHHGGVRRPPLRGVGAHDPPDPATRVGPHHPRRGARGAGQHVPQSARHREGARQARTDRHTGARGYAGERHQLPHRTETVRGQLARPAAAGTPGDGAVRRGVVPDDRRVLPRVPAARTGQAQAAVRDEPEQVPHLRVSDALSRGARRQPAQPGVQHHYAEQGGRHVDRPARGQRDHPNQRAVRLAATGGAAARTHPATETAAGPELQRVLLLAGEHRHRRDVIAHIAEMAQYPSTGMPDRDQEMATLAAVLAAEDAEGADTSLAEELERRRLAKMSQAPVARARRIVHEGAQAVSGADGLLYGEFARGHAGAPPASSSSLLERRVVRHPLFRKRRQQMHAKAAASGVVSRRRAHRTPTTPPLPPCATLDASGRTDRSAHNAPRCVASTAGGAAVWAR
eukprot:ctg_2535.g446